MSVCDKCMCQCLWHAVRQMHAYNSILRSQNKANWTKILNSTGYRSALRHVIRATSSFVGAMWLMLRSFERQCHVQVHGAP